MNFKRIGRLLVCLVLICALLINVSPIKAKADVVSGAVVVGGAVVSVPVAIAVAATLVAIGIIADAAADNPAAFQSLVDVVTDSLTAAGTYVKDGCVEMYRFITDTGEAVYYAAADFMECVRSESFASVISDSPVYEFSGGQTYTRASGTVITSTKPFQVIKYHYYDSTAYGRLRYCELIFSTHNAGWKNAETGSSISSSSPSIDGDIFQVLFNSYLSDTSSIPAAIYSGSISLNGVVSTSGSTSDVYRRLIQCYVASAHFGYAVADGLTLAELLTSPIDGTSARAWSEAYANRGLYIASGGNQGAPDDGAEGNDGWKFLLPLTLASAAILAAMSQTEQWTGTTPPEFDDYTEKEELTVTPAPEFDGYQAIEIAPVTNPNPDPNPEPGPGTGSDPDSGGDSAELNWWQRFSQWFLELRTSINELPNRFDEHFENVNNNIQEVPNKFETWIRNVQTSVDAVAENILGTAEEINATINELPNTFFGQLPVILSAIAAVPEAILAGLRSLFQELFVPSQEYLNNKLQDLVNAYPYLQPIISLGDTFKAYLNGVNPTAPVIWIDLGASQWHPLGGRVKFIDLTWYAQYKPTVDGILGAFLWLCLLWRLFQAAPGIVQGASGFFGNADPHPDGSFSGSNWIAGQRFLTGGFGKRNE